MAREPTYEELEQRVKALEHEARQSLLTEEALRESEERYRTVIEHSNDGVAVLKGNVHQYVNQRFAQIFGYESIEDIIGKPLSINVHPDDLQKVTRISDQRQKGGQAPSRYEHKGIRKDGEIIYIEVSVTKITYQGEPVSLAYLRDITEKKMAEKALRESEERFRAIVETALDGIFLKDRNLKYILVNPSLARIHGIPASSMVGRSDGEIFGPDVGKRLFREDSRVLNGEIIVADKENVGGTSKILQIIKVPMRDQKGDITGICGIARDITETRGLETQLQQAQKMEAIGTLAGGIAHDFNNILTPFIVHTEIALMDIPEASPVRYNLQEALKAGHRAKDLVKQILTFSRQSEQEPKPLRIGSIIKEALQLLRASLPTTIEIRQNIISKSDIAVADPTQIHQVLMNLCTNAAHAMREKGGVLEVKLDDATLNSSGGSSIPGLSPGHYLKLTVSDTGSGMNSTVMERVFEPYFTTKEKGEGTGLGLAVVHGILKGFGGSITVKSKPGKGTVFDVYLPKIEGDLSAASKGIKPVPKGSERILLVDDEKAMVDAVQQMLERLNYKVTSRVSSIEALEAFRAKPEGFDLIITDQTMPNMTGSDLAQELMAVRSDIPIILCTGYSEIINEERANQMGIRAFIMKPIIMSEMAGTIRQVLDEK